MKKPIRSSPDRRRGASLPGAKKPGDDTSNPAYAVVPFPLTADPSGKPAKPVFKHPGVLLNRAQLAEIKRRVAAGIEPQKSAFEALKASKLAALDYTPHPRETVECGSNSNPDLGCKDEQADSEAAYAQALMLAVTGNKAYAAERHQNHERLVGTLTGGHTNDNGPVQAAWSGEVWPRAAEIIRYTYKGWSDADIAKFKNMLTTQYVPSLVNGSCENGNKELSMSEALINIGVFNDDRAAFDLGVKMWRGRAPAYIYLKSDGPTPVEPPAATSPFGATKATRPSSWTVCCRKPRAIPATPTWPSPPWSTPPRPPGSRASISTPSRASASWPPSNSRRSSSRPTAPSPRRIWHSTTIPPGKSPTTISTTGSATSCRKWRRSCPPTGPPASITT